MPRRPSAEHPRELRRIPEKKQERNPRARLRIMIASDPNRPIRTISLPRALPKVVSVVAGTLVLATVLLACGSWKMRGALAALERRVRAMVQAADSVALRPEAGEGGPIALAAAGRMPAARAPAGPIGRFEMESANTGEQITVELDLSTGEVQADAYRSLRHFMRCLRTTAETPIDPRLIDLLYRIAQRTRQKVILVSGFRAPMFSMAALSYHTRGMAADIRIPGMTPLMVRDLAESMGVHGLGYYPVSGFVHVDVRDERMRWIDYGANRQDGEGAEHSPEHGEITEAAAE
jgi:uncharacterized protein YcbK (DUF882 family)